MNKILLLPLLALLVSVSGCKKAKHEYTVEMRNGVPFLHVDGKPVRNRVFYCIEINSSVNRGKNGSKNRYDKWWNC